MSTSARGLAVVVVISLALLEVSTLYAAKSEQGEVESRGALGMQREPLTPIVLPPDPLAAPPTPGWHYLSLGPSAFQLWPSVDPIANPASTSFWHGGLRWSAGRIEVIGLIQFSDGAVVQELTCVANVSAFQCRNQPVNVKLVANLEREVFGKEPGEDQSKRPVYRSVAHAVGPDAGTGLLVLGGPAYLAHRVDNLGFVYWVRFTRYLPNANILDANFVPPVELRGCQIAYTV